MLKEWQFNILFFVGVGGAVFLLVGPEFGLNIAENPTALAGVGSILTYILTQRSTLTRNDHKDRRRKIRNDDEEEDDPKPVRRPNREERGDES